MPELAKCLRCEKLFVKVRSAVCPDCEREEEREIFELQRHLRDHPNRTIEEVSDALDIYVEDIERWIAEKRLTVTVGGLPELKCIFCGAKILTGRICNRCGEGIGTAPAQPKPHPSRAVTGGSRERPRGTGPIKKFRR